MIWGIERPTSFLPYVIAGLFLAVGNVLLTYSIYRIDVTVLSPFFALRTAFTAVLGLFLLNERFTIIEYLLMAVIFVCGVLVKIDEKFSWKKFRTDSLWLATLCMFFLALSSVAIKISSTGGTYWNNMFWINVFTVTFLTATIPIFRRELIKTPIKKYLGALGYSTFGGLGRVLMFYGLAINATITTIVISLPISMLITIPLAYVSPELLEKHTTKVYVYRLIVAAVMIGSSIKLSLR